MNNLLDEPVNKTQVLRIPNTEELILIRLAIPAKAPPGPKKVRHDVGTLLGEILSEQTYTELIDKLLADDLLAKGRGKARVITEAGRARALDVLGLAAFPVKYTWQSVIVNHWFPLATGMAAQDAAKLKSADHCAALLLRRRYGLSDNSGNSIKQVAEALVCQQLGYPQLSNLQELAQHVLGTMIGNSTLNLKQIHQQLPCFETGLKTSNNAKAIRELFVRQWLQGAPGPLPEDKHSLSATPDQEGLDLPTFAATVRRFAHDSLPDDRFHDDKVFVVALWRLMQHEPQLPQMSLVEFKQHLVESNTANLLQLRRADLVQVMDSRLVEESEIHYLNATFHFVLID